MPCALPYDRSDRDSILRHAQRLVGKTLREALSSLPENAAGKGRFGTVLEEYYFGYKPNGRSEADFLEAGLELKSTPCRRRGKHLVAKERLFLGNIDYAHVTEETWEGSSLLKKAESLLLVVYLYEPEKHFLDYEIRRVALWEFPLEDLEIIKQDWELIVDKVGRGLAHELSCGDTLYLEAAPHGANRMDVRAQPFSSIPAMRRAFCLKQSYMTAVIGGLPKTQSVPDALKELRMGVRFEDIVAERFRPYVGCTAEEIAELLDVRAKPRAKNYYAVITKRILGVGAESEVAEFRKADLIVKTVRLKHNGVPKEDLPFRAFDYCDLAQQEWAGSELRESLSKRFLFVLYQLPKGAGSPRLVGIRFWTMPVADVEGPARECFERTVQLIREDKAEYLPRKSENVACHVRPHGRDSKDVLPAPSGRLVCRKSFWLNGTYIASQLGTRKATL